MDIDIQPKDPSKGHFYVSLAKSFLRIVACVCLILAGAEAGAGGALLVTSQMVLMGAWIKIAGGLLLLAECLGIAEELV